MGDLLPACQIVIERPSSVNLLANCPGTIDYANFSFRVYFAFCFFLLDCHVGGRRISQSGRACLPIS